MKPARDRYEPMWVVKPIWAYVNAISFAARQSYADSWNEVWTQNVVRARLGIETRS